MRNPQILLSSNHFSLSNAACPSSPVENKNFIKYKCDGGSGAHLFKHCSWNNIGLSSNGGAIHCVLTERTKQPSASLTVDKCTFLHCHETGTVDGGAIHARYIGTASVSDSFFYDCECGSSSGQEGAGVCYAYLSTNPSISRCLFVCCTSLDDGGGCGIWYSHSRTPYAIDSCSFLECKGLSADGSEGGGMYLYRNYDFIICTNCFFAFCSTPFHGGGIAISYVSSSTITPLTFCYFHMNTAGDVNDIFFYYTPTLYEDILNSFSTSTPHRICYVANEDDWKNSDAYHYEDNWLPQANINTQLKATVGRTSEYRIVDFYKRLCTLGHSLNCP